MKPQTEPTDTAPRPISREKFAKTQQQLQSPSALSDTKTLPLSDTDAATLDAAALDAATLDGEAPDGAAIEEALLGARPVVNKKTPQPTPSPLVAVSRVLGPKEVATAPKVPRQRPELAAASQQVASSQQAGDRAAILWAEPGAASPAPEQPITGDVNECLALALLDAWKYKRVDDFKQHSVERLLAHLARVRGLRWADCVQKPASSLANVKPTAADAEALVVVKSLCARADESAWSVVARCWSAVAPDCAQTLFRDFRARGHSLPDTVHRLCVALRRCERCVELERESRQREDDEAWAAFDALRQPSKRRRV
jgi:hypothetical protein